MESGTVLQVLDFRRYAMAKPMLGESGTYMLLVRTFGGDEGRLLRDDATETALWFRADGRIDVTSSVPGTDWRSCHPLPLGYATALVMRYQPGHCEVGAWSIEGGYPEAVKVGSGGKLQLAAGVVNLGSSPLPGVIPHAECFGASSVPTWLGEHSIRAAVANESLEVVFGARSIDDLLSHIGVWAVGAEAVSFWH